MKIRTIYSNNVQQLAEVIERLRIKGWIRNSVESLRIRENPRLLDAVLRRVQQIAEATDPKIIAYLAPEHQILLLGELTLGTVLGSDSVALQLPLQAIARHTFIAGSSGSGKSQCAMKLAESVFRAGVGSVRVIDPKASEHLALARKYPHVVGLGWKHIRLKVFTPPPNVPWIEWIQSVISHLSEALNFWEGAEALLLKHIVKLKESGIDPTIRDLIRSLQSDRGIFGQKDAMVRSTAISRLEWLENLFGSAISTESDMLVCLSKHAAIISTSGLMSTAESWYTEFLLLWEYFYRVYNPEARGLSLRIFEECQHRVFSIRKEYSQHQSSAPLISKLIDEARSLGLGICSLSQEPSTVIRAVQNNAYVRVAFRLGSGSEIRVVREAMGLTEEQADVLFYLEPGEAIVRLAGGYMEPMLVKFDEFEATNFCSDADFTKHQAELREQLYREAGVSPDRHLVSLTAPQYHESTPTSADNSSISTPMVPKTIEPVHSRPPASAQTQLTNDRVSSVSPLLSVWLNLPNPFLTQGELFEKAGVKSGSKQSSMKNQLVNQGLVIEHRLQLGKTFASILEPTQKAFDQLGLAMPSYHSKGGYLHQFIAHRVIEWIKAQGLKPEIEFMLSNGKAVDVAWREGEAWIFVEIGISPPLEKEVINLVKDIGSNLVPGKLILLAVDSKARTELQSLVRRDAKLADWLDRIDIRLAGEFLKP